MGRARARLWAATSAQTRPSTKIFWVVPYLGRVFFVFRASPLDPAQMYTYKEIQLYRLSNLAEPTLIEARIFVFSSLTLCLFSSSFLTG